MNIIISNSSGRPIYEQIASQLKHMIMTGQLKAHDALPSMRALARDLRISVITTKRAYEDLERDGFLYTIVGKGSFVAESNRELMKEEQLKEIETILNTAIGKAGQAGVSMEELQEMLRMLGEEV